MKVISAEQLLEPFIKEARNDIAISSTGRYIEYQEALQLLKSADLSISYWKKRAELFEKSSEQQNSIFIQAAIELEKIKLLITEIQNNETSVHNKIGKATKKNSDNQGAEQGSSDSKEASGQLPNSDEVSMESTDKPFRFPVTHKLKTDYRVYSDVESGKKNFEIRYDDRGYTVGDYLQLKEVNTFAVPTGKQCSRKIIYMLRGKEWGLQEGFVILGLDILGLEG